MTRWSRLQYFALAGAALLAAVIGGAFHAMGHL